MPLATEKGGVSEEAAREQLTRISSSRVFARSDRMKRFLSFVVERSLKGADPDLKEYTIALAVYDKPASFDQRLDPIIRVEASRLRAKLREYYEDEGRHDAILISIRKRGYAAVIKRRAPANQANSTGIPPAIAETIPKGTENLEAHHLFLKGRYCWNKRTPESISEAISFFNRAIAMDPQYALAYAGLGDCYASQAWLDAQAGQMLWPLAEKTASRALEIDKSLTQPLTTLACKQAIFDWDWNAAEATFRRAIGSERAYATAHHWYALFCLAPQRRLNAALTEIAKACELDPLSPIIGTHVGCVLYFRRQYEDALDQFRRTIELDPGFHLVYWHMAFAHCQASQFDEAVRALEQAMEISRGAWPDKAAVGLVYANMGRRPDAENILEQLQAVGPDEYISPVSVAMIHAALDDRDAAFESLTRARDERASRLIHVKIEPAFDRLKTDARFLSLLSSIGLL